MTEARQYAFALLSALAVLLIPAPASASDSDDEDEGLSLESTRTIEFETSKGTWLSLDVAPDGERIVFEPYTRDLFDSTQKWMAENDLFSAGEVGAVNYESAVV